MSGWSGPLTLDVSSICTASNRELNLGVTPSVAWGDSWPCYINAGTIASVAILGSGLAIIVGLIIHAVSMRWPKGDEHTNWGMKMNKLAFLTKRGSTSWFSSMAMYLMVFAVWWFLVILVIFSARQRSDATDGIRYAACYLVAVLVMLFPIYMVMVNCSESFTRTARAAMNMGGVSGSLRTAFSSGVVAAFLGIGTSVLFLAIMYLFMTLQRDRDVYSAYGNLCSRNNGTFCGQALAWQTLCGFAFGISTVSILVRGMAGIFGKAAEVGSELIHKLEPDSSIEMSKNPASVADKTGAIAVDGVAMMIDIVESLIITIVSAGLLAQGHSARMAIPFWVAGASFLSGLIAYAFVRCSNAGVLHVADRYRNMMWGIRIGMYLTAFLTLVWMAVIIGILYTNYPGFFGGERVGWYLYACLFLGVLTSVLVWEFTSYFTASSSSPTRSVAAAGITGASTMLIQGLGVGLLSTLPIAFLIMMLIIACGAIGGQYGIALASIGLASQCWFAIAANVMAPVAYAGDSCVDQPETAAVREVTVSLHMAGESCAAETRGWSTAASILAAFSALAAFRQEAGLEAFQLQGTESDVISEGIMFACAVLGGFTPFFCAGINVLAIGKATRALVDETRRQFQHIAGFVDCNPEAISKATCYPAAMGALLPAFMLILIPASVGFLIGARALSAFTAGAIFAGGSAGLFMFNAGATWCKSKTSVEAEGAFGGSGSDAHIASVIGTRTGNALKDVAAPTMVTGIKTIAMTALLIAPLIFIDRNAPYYLSCLTDKWASSISILACYDWNKAYWAALPLFFLGVLGLIFYFAFWNRDGTPAPRQQVYQVENQPVMSPGGMMMAPSVMPMQTVTAVQPAPIVTTTVPVMNQVPVMSMQQPFGIVGQGYPEPYMAAPMRPEMGSVDQFVNNGYQVAQPMY
eukprot:CAMPEP_0206232930 /NCGR_PEP_ID=MMETSP0047_2-20121206/11693_1 /ASSEMBLY_ACC=CAM_ASM_000192 /TAXON_ID=195065 /ORGANISM="Chroomonas mesostigmatica_cf, Strain CCMP1168" /LENGTH=918 /DNA_ID=CAMNT_0053656729 /DNA_START=47 /DNA_END=2803 /DNA_ORIENTATION=+